MNYDNIKYQVSSDSKILFIGTNPSPGSYYNGIPFSSNQSFWYLLNDAGLLTETRDDLKNDTTLKKTFLKKFTKIYHLGLMNLIYRPTKSVAQVTQKEAIPGSLRIISVIEKYQPPVVCFVGKGTYQLFTQTARCTYGWQITMGVSQLYVMHSPIHGFAYIRINELKEIGKAASLL